VATPVVCNQLQRCTRPHAALRLQSIAKSEHDPTPHIPYSIKIETEVQTMAIVTRKHRRQPSKLLKRMRAAVQAGKWKKANWLVVEWLRSPEAKRLRTIGHRAMRPIVGLTDQR
jgi:hypothetical protein